MIVQVGQCNHRVLITEGQRQQRENQHEKTGPAVAGLEGGGGGRPVRERRQPLEARTGKGMESPPEPPGGKQPNNTLIFRLVTL